MSRSRYILDWIYIYIYIKSCIRCSSSPINTQLDPPPSHLVEPVCRVRVDLEIDRLEVALRQLDVHLKGGAGCTTGCENRCGEGERP